MRENRTYHKLLLAFNVLYALFCATAINYRMQSAGLPEELSHPASKKHIRFIDGVPVQNQYEIDFTISRYRIGDVVRIESDDEQYASETQSVRLIPAYSLSEIIVAALTGFIMFGLGLFVYLSHPHKPPSVVFNIVSVMTASALLGMREMYSFSTSFIGQASAVLFFISNVLFAISFVHFTFVFPAVDSAKVRRSLTVLYATGILLAALESRVYLQVVASGSIDELRRSAHISVIHNSIILLLLLFGIANFIISYKRTIDMREKKRLRWILFGLSAGPMPFMALWLLPQAFGSSPLIRESYFTLFLLLIPVTFSISIVRHRVMDIDILVNRSVVYSILVGVVLLVSVTIVQFLVRTIGMPPAYVPALVAVCIALFVERLRQSVQRFVDKNFFGVQYNYREAQRKFMDEIKMCLDVRQLVMLIVKRTNELIPTERIGFFAVDRANRLQLIEHQNFDILQRDGIHVERKLLKNDLRKPIALPDAVEMPAFSGPADEQVFKELGIAIMFPIIAEQANISGLLVLGKKKFGTMFSLEDVDLLSTVAVQAAFVLQRIELQKKFILEHEETKRLEELNELKSYFVSSVSHDLKTPLTSIKMFAELLQSGKKISKGKTQEYLDIIEGESDRLSRLINNVLDFAKVERGVKEYHFSHIALNDVVLNVLKSMEYQLKMERCSVKMKFSKKDVVIHADFDAVVEALVNVVSNAMKYSPKVKQITVTTFQQHGFSGVTIQDKGIGIAKEDFQKIFEPFVRAKDEKARQVGGTGLGLSLVKHIMDAHGGKVEVESTPRKGSSFTLLFPVGAV